MCVWTDYSNTIIAQVIESQSFCTMCDTIVAPLDDYVRDCALFWKNDKMLLTFC